MLAEPRPDILDDRYEIGSLLGRGGMGDVHRAIDHRLGREVAVKFLRNDLAAQPDVRNRFEAEARSAARLSHPNVVMVLDSGEFERCPYLVMECLPGRTLYDELVRGPLPPDRVRAVAYDVLGALGAAHDLGILHRDVKPGNILLTDDGRAKLADFGIAKSTEGLDHTLVGQVLGTPAYLAPERLTGEPATPSADLYALGVVLYEALTGKQPFRGDTPIAVAHAIATSDAEPLSQRCAEVDPALAAVIEGAMLKDREGRFQSAAEMSRALAAVDATPTRWADEAGEPTRILAPAGATTVLSDAPARPLTRRDRTTPGGLWRTGPRELRLLAVAAVVLALIVAAVIAAGDSSERGATDSGSSTQPTAGQPGGAQVPAPLDDAIDDLERAVNG
ncbi:MAG TPA: serine/threonine-protein kinase [Acidimicrobiales bacterium]|nr:serine/threonine-protein kinase [Acidimicrobiales bacterium]